MSEITHRKTGVVLYAGNHATMAEAVSAAVSTDANLSDANLRDANLSDANLSGAYLHGANLRVANLNNADLSDANLSGAYLHGANLRVANLNNADLSDANLSGANLSGANLSEANLRGADLRDATMPCGRTWEEYQLDPLAGICQTPEARARAIAARDGHSWADCPMHAALGIGGLDEIKEADTRRLVAAFVAVHDGRLLDAAWDRIAIDTDLDEGV
jgi:hypothetical protein